MSKAAARLMLIRRVKAMGQWRQPQRMHYRLRPVLDARSVAERKEAAAARKEAAVRQFIGALLASDMVPTQQCEDDPPTTQYLQ